MLGFLTKKPVLVGLAALVIVTALGLGYHHYTGLLDKVEVLQARSGALQLGLDTEREAVVQLQDVVSEWETAQQELITRVEEMQTQAREARDETRRLRQLFAELDFEAMAPATLDSVATDVLDRLWNLLEDATDPGRYDPGRAATGEATAPEAGASGDPASGLDSGRDGRRAGPGPD